ncbi:hypothetical protein K2X05_10005 [bacterium]|nr:hypothetical protein [bacterium]
MIRNLFYLLAIVFSACSHNPSPNVPSLDRAPNNAEDGESSLQKYLARKKSDERSRLQCSSENSKATVVFYSKAIEDQMNVFIYGNILNYEILIPYFNGEVSKATTPGYINVHDGEVMKEFDGGIALTQRFDLDYDKKTLKIEIVEKGWFYTETIIASSYLSCK